MPKISAGKFSAAEANAVLNPDRREGVLEVPRATVTVSKSRGGLYVRDVVSEAVGVLTALRDRLTTVKLRNHKDHTWELRSTTKRPVHNARERFSQS